MATIAVSVGRDATYSISRDVFCRLFDNSVVSESAKYRHALETSRISFTELEKLARKADIPSSLFFAPRSVVDAQIGRKLQILLEGVGKDQFSMSSRGPIRVTDVELIIKDLLRKQSGLKKADPSLTANSVVGCISSPRLTPTSAADLLANRIGLNRDELRRRDGKGKAFEYLIDLLEIHNVFVSQSVRNWMPQNVPKRARFSGMCIKDKKVPFAFINSSDARGSVAPAGRRLFTLTLLVVCIGRGKFRRVSYDEQSDDLISNVEWEIAEEVLMPAAEMRVLTITSLNDVKAHANTCAVTPSAILMRARRLGLVNEETSHDYLQTLRDEFRQITRPPSRSPLPTTALRKYNGAGFSRAYLAAYDEGRVSASEVKRVLFQNRSQAPTIQAFRETL